MAASDRPNHSTVKSAGVLFFFDFALPHGFNYLDQKLTQNVGKIICYYHVTKWFLPCVNWLIICFCFRRCFGKALVAFGFDEKLTQSVVQTTIQYHVSKEFLRLYFAVDQVLSISEHHLENGRMPCNQKYWIKNMAVKILILILLRFRLLC